MAAMITIARLRSRIKHNWGLVLFTVVATAGLLTFLIRLFTGPSQVMLTVDESVRATRIAVSFRRQTGKRLEAVWQSDSLPVRDSVGPILTGATGLLLMRVFTSNATSNRDTTVSFRLQGSSTWYVSIVRGARPENPAVPREWSWGRLAIPLRRTDPRVPPDTLWVEWFGGPRPVAI